MDLVYIFIFCSTIAVNMNSTDEANLARVLRSLGCGENKRGGAQKQKTCCLFEGDGALGLLLLQRQIPSLLCHFASCWTTLRLFLPNHH